MRLFRIALRSGMLALGFMMAGNAAAQVAVGLPVTDSTLKPRSIQAYQLPNGMLGTSQVIVSPLTGQAYNLLNGQPMAPAVAAAYPVSRSFQIVNAGIVYTAMPAVTSTPRKGGFCQASFSNTGVIGLAASGQQPATPPSVSNDVELVAGQSFDMNQHGYAIQGALLAVGTAAGDRLLCQDLQ